MVASGHGFMEVVDLALHRPAEYGHILHEASPMIDAFGGAFLIMIGLSYFIDYNKRVHWMRHVEPWPHNQFQTFFPKDVILHQIQMALCKK